VAERDPGGISDAVSGGRNEITFVAIRSSPSTNRRSRTPSPRGSKQMRA
jgi:hypothetical protein